MKIGVFSESYKPYISGVTISIETLVSELRTLGHEVYIFAPSHPEAETDPNIYRFPSIRTHYPGFRLSLPFSRRILKEIPKLDLDIIHTHSPYQTGLLALYFARKLKIPIVYTLHTLFAQYLHYVPLLPKPVLRGILSTYLRGFCNRCDTVIVPTAVVKETLLRDRITSRIEVLPTGVDMDTVDAFSGEGIRERFNIKKETALLLYVGRLSKEKNLYFLLDAFSIVLKYFPETKLMLVAKGPLEKSLRKYARNLKVSGNVIFTGEVKFPEVFNYYKASDLFVFSSLTETQGLVLTEALASGLPIVAIAAEGAKEMVKNGEDGFLTGPSKEDFAYSIIELIINKPLRESMKKRARERAIAAFSSKAMAVKALDIYSSLL
ncbi:MAG: glycosyltransferase family 4 protein [Candidatus Saganbacteria bacterium]|nr:glycosyltransferase family 4 protein [Candidatus Saganbacteria bacterium]